MPVLAATELCRASRLEGSWAGIKTDMRSAFALMTTGVVALVVAVSSYACGAAHIGTASGTLALLITGAGLALINQATRASAGSTQGSVPRSS
jgi:hypothetical protein